MNDNFSFICDEMLFHLGRWLRAAGYDTIFVKKSERDQEILKQAIATNRILLTRDKYFLKLKDKQVQLMYFPSANLEECVKKINKILSIDWLFQPLSRCLICNANLKSIGKEALINLNIPIGILNRFQKFWYCESCQKIYWLGSHAEHMLVQLKKWSLKTG